MSVKFKFKGRTFSSASSLQSALRQEMRRNVDQAVRRAASGTGTSVQKTHNGYRLNGSPEQLARFNKRLGR